METEEPNQPAIGMSPGGAKPKNRFKVGVVRWWCELRIGFPGVWLFFLYAMFGLLVIFSLSAYQLQFSIKSSTKADGTSVGLWEVLQVHSEWNSLSRATESNGQLLTHFTREQVLRENQKAEISDEIALADTSCRALISAFRRYLGKHRLLPVDHQDFKNNCAHQEFNETKGEAQSRFSANEDDPPEFHDHVNGIAAAIDDFDEIQIKSEQVKNEITRFNGTIDGLRIKIENDKSKISDLLSNSKLGVGSGDFLNALSYLGAREGLPLIPSFSRMPSDMLTLILVMSMGALGGTISLTRLYLKQKKNDTSTRIGGAQYLFRPLLGAITALAIFILAKAGVLIISNPAQGGGALSPFFISFLGIISGLLADQALDTIQRTGTNWFDNSGLQSQERWAYGLAEALGQPIVGNTENAEANAAFKEQQQLLINILGVSPATLNQWITEERPVPWREQSLIAAFLHIPPRQIFSDMQSGLIMKAPDSH